MRLAVCEGSVLVLLSGSFYFLLPKKKKEKKRKTTTASGSVCESCMPLLLSVLVSLKPMWQDHPFLKRQAALQLWPGTASLIQRDCTTLLRAHVQGAARWPVGEEGQREGRHSAFSSPLTVAVISGEKSFFLCVHKLLVNPADRLQAGDEWEHWLLLHNTHKLTLKYIYICIWVRPSGLQDSQLPGVTDVPSGCRV